MILTCYAEGRNGAWEAICANFDIAVQGISFDDVHSRLSSPVEDYLEYVVKLPEAERANFLKRRVPWLVRARIAFKFVSLAIWNRASNTKERYNYTLSCAA